EHLRQMQDAIEARHRADRPADPDEDGRLAEASLHRARGGKDRRMIARGRDPAHVAGALDLDAHAARSYRRQELRDDSLDVRGVLIADEPSRDLRLGPARHDRLGAGALVAAPHAVELERGTQPHPLERRTIELPAGELVDA